jgi:cation-transporting ATPase 13A3/4/5
MWESSGWNFEAVEGNSDIKAVFTHKNERIEIFATHEFRSQYQSMCILAKINEKYYLFIKGSPEKLFELAKDKGIVRDLQKKTEYYTIQGVRILALGYKELTQDQF